MLSLDKDHDQFSMDVQKLLQNLREEVSCPLCQEIFNDPRHLPCLHSFCLQCLKDWHRENNGQEALRCPKCQRRSRFPASGDLKDLPTNSYLERFIDALTNQTQVTCGNCDKKCPESFYCFQCCILFCEKCLKCHSMLRMYDDHRVLSTKEFQNKDREDVLKQSGSMQKEVGTEKDEVQFVNEKVGESPGRQTCVTLPHAAKEQEVSSIEEEALEVRSQLRVAKETLQAKMNLVAQIEEECAQVVQDGAKMERDVDKFTDKLMKTVEAKKRSLMAAVQNETNRSLSSIASKRATIQQEIKNMESALESAERFLTYANDVDVVRFTQPLQAMLEGLDQSEPIDRNHGGLFDLVFVGNNRFLDNFNSEGLGVLETRPRTQARESVAESNQLEINDGH